jgi:hypothetical protein
VEDGERDGWFTPASISWKLIVEYYQAVLG